MRRIAILLLLALLSTACAGEELDLLDGIGVPFSEASDDPVLRASAVSAEEAERAEQAEAFALVAIEDQSYEDAQLAADARPEDPRYALLAASIGERQGQPNFDQDEQRAQSLVVAQYPWLSLEETRAIFLELRIDVYRQMLQTNRDYAGRDLDLFRYCFLVEGFGEEYADISPDAVARVAQRADRDLCQR